MIDFINSNSYPFDNLALLGLQDFWGPFLILFLKLSKNIPPQGTTMLGGVFVVC